MSNFITDNFLLDNNFAIKLYHEYAINLPIIDYHSHLSPKDICNNRKFKNISEAWLEDDHYKWRAMRTMGVEEKYITGKSSNKEKFKKWSSIIPDLIRNPLYHWTHLELLRYFGFNKFLDLNNAEYVYDLTSEKLSYDSFSTRGLLKMMNVKSICTTDDPLDDLSYHKEIKASNFEINVGCTFRPDNLINILSKDFTKYINDFGLVSNFKIKNLTDLKNAIVDRINFFHESGCRISDHGLNFIPFEDIKEKEIEIIFKKKISGNIISYEESLKYQTLILIFLSELYYKNGWVQQFHLGAMRNNNSRMKDKIGKDAGFDSIGSYPMDVNLSKFLDKLDSNGKLAKTILYNSNPSDNAFFASIIGNFNDGSHKGKIQWGSGWWFLDQLEGMTNHLNTLSNIGIISTFIGMITDSRSFLSFPRHEYFRRLLCNMFGKDIEKGLIPNDMNLIGEIISKICFYNAKEYFEK